MTDQLDLYPSRAGAREKGAASAAMAVAPSSVWRKIDMGTFAIEHLPITGVKDKNVEKGLRAYCDRMTELGKTPVPRLRGDDYKRMFDMAIKIDATIVGMTYRGFRVLRG